MSLRLYLNGDGKSQGSHMSLFFVLMRSAFDPILAFPFCFKIIFCLCDQTGQHDDIIDSFRPDLSSTSFHRPRTDMNIASGIPAFVPLSTLLQTEKNLYVRDDTIFIQVLVDFGNLPKELIPYALSLHPALNTELRQAMVREQLETLRHPPTTTDNVPLN